MSLTTSPLQDTIVFFQGAGRAPGPALVRSLAAQGARVAACDLSPALLNPLEAAGPGLSGQIRAYVGDTARGMPARAILDEVAEDWGPVEILINNPRIALNTSILQTDEWDWQHTIEANLNGTFLLTHLIGRQMAEQGSGGVMINLIAAPTPGLTVPGRAAYAASQMGLLALTRAAAQEFKAYNIRVYGVCVDEDENAGDQAARLWKGEVSPQDPSLRLLFSLEELIVFLCSPSAAHLPGQVLQPDAAWVQE